MAFSIALTSATVLPNGPICSRLFAYDIRPYLLTRPYVGFKPTTEQKLAGHLTEPPVSEPSDRAHSSAATLAALPPDDPPGTLAMSHGFLVAPFLLNSVVDPIANSSRFVLPIRMAPASKSVFTTVASYGGTKLSSIFDAHVVLVPFTQMLSLMLTATPASGPTCSPSLILLSSHRALSSASPPVTVIKAFTFGSTFSIRSSSCWTYSSAEKSLFLIPAATCAESSRYSCILGHPWALHIAVLS